MHARAALDRTASPSPDLVVDVLRGVADPEIPNVSIVDLGMIGDVAVADGPDGAIRVELLPTFVGCHALPVIEADVARAIAAAFDRPVEVEASMRTPWTSDRITDRGRQQLRRSGFAPPPHTAESPSGPEAVACPHCGSERVAMDSLFGPTQCRSLFYCRDCRQPFEAFKPV